MVALGWLKCRVLSKGHCSSRACSLCQDLWSCMVNHRAGLPVNVYLIGWVLPGLLAKKMLVLIQGRGDCKRRALRGAGLLSVLVTLKTGIKWSWSPDCCLGKGDRWLLCLGIYPWQKAACLFQRLQHWPFLSPGVLLGLYEWAIFCISSSTAFLCSKTSDEWWVPLLHSTSS